LDPFAMFIVIYVNSYVFSVTICIIKLVKIRSLIRSLIRSIKNTKKLIFKR
jgi:hypothetical protein